MHIFPKKGEGGGSKNWQKTLQENEFDRFVQFWISVFLFPKSVRKCSGPAPTMNKIPKATV